MADTKTSALTAATTVDPADLVMTVDVSDTSMAASGTNKKATREQLQTYAAGTLTTDKKVADYSATWNNGAVAFTGVKVAITDTASDAASAIADLQVGGSSKFKVGKDGAVTAAAGVSGTTLTSTVSTGTAPLTVASTTAVTNLNADLLDGNHAAAFVTSASLGTGVGTALAVNTGSAGAFVVNGGALGTPSSGTLTNATGLPVSTGVSGLGTGVATALAVNTGSSGAVVVNGGALGTPSSGTVTNLTGTASININGTVGATTPTTGAFTTLSASGVATFSAGTVTAPAITTSGDTNNGIYFPAADVTAITTAGSERMRVNAVGGVGIGVTSIDTRYKLQTVASDVGFDLFKTGGAAQGYYLNFRPTLTAGSEYNCSISTYDHSGDTNTDGISINGYDGVSICTGSNTRQQRMIVDSSGNVGIGTSSPATRLEVASAGDTRIKVNNTANTVTAEFGAAATETFIAAYNSKPLTFYTGGSDRMVINSSGNVGIGTSSPVGNLNVYSGSGAAVINIQTPNGGSSGTGLYFRPYQSASDAASNPAQASIVATDSNYSANLIFSTKTPGALGNALTERMRIDSSGNVQVGTSSQLYSSKLTVEAGTTNATTYTTVAAKGGSSMAQQQQSTTGVSTSLVTILTPGSGPYAAFCVVFGSDGTNRFIDLVLFSVGTGTINVISSLSAAGSPAARTYAQNSSSLQLSMGSGTYTVQVTTIGMGS